MWWIRCISDYYSSFFDNNTFTDMLWVLTGILSRVEEVWVHVTKVQTRQSYWHGWLRLDWASLLMCHHLAMWCYVTLFPIGDRFWKSHTILFHDQFYFIFCIFIYLYTMYVYTNMYIYKYMRKTRKIIIKKKFVLKFFHWVLREKLFKQLLVTHPVVITKDGANWSWKSWERLTKINLPTGTFDLTDLEKTLEISFSQRFFWHFH